MPNLSNLQPALEKQDTPTVWHGCYDGGWQNLITEQAFQHPAKFSRNLINRIYAYALKRGWLKPGDTVLDPFGGGGLGALDAQANGLNWVGVELERRFCDLGQGCDCTGISKADWVRFYGRWDKVAHKDGRHWCPQCLVEAKQIVSGNSQLSFFEPAPSAAYIRNSGIIPETKPHHYTGNLELFKRYARPGTFAVLLNGDSRNLRAVIGQGVAAGLLSSPPYASTEVNPGNVGNAIKRETWGKGIKLAAGSNGYGKSNGQLGAMPAGSLADSLLSSPPFSPDQPCASQTRAKKDYHAFTRGDGTKRDHVMRSKENLDGLPMVGFDAALSSPPFAGNTGGRGEASRQGIDAALFDRHSGGMKKGTGDNPGNLDHLPMRGLTDALLSSPPFEQGSEGVMRASKFKNPAAFAKAQMNKGHGCSFEAKMRAMEADNDRAHYGSTPGQLGTEQGGTFWEAAKMIVSEAYLALKDDSYQFWVVKAFIRDGKRVDFPDQWRQLCEACGFEYVETIRAMLVKDNGTQVGLNGEDKRLRVERKSFFRRLFESRLDEDEGHLRIDYEEVVVMRKPGGRQ